MHNMVHIIQDPYIKILNFIISAQSPFAIENNIYIGSRDSDMDIFGGAVTQPATLTWSPLPVSHPLLLIST